MQISDDVRKCVAFLYFLDADDSLTVAGTGFFILDPLRVDPSRGILYLVTARHVVEGIRARSSHESVHVRLNDASSGVRWFQAPLDKWNVDDDADRTSDVAMLRVTTLDRAEFDYRSFPIARLATDEVIDSQKIGPGDEVAVVGLFVNHFGSERNIPIVRVGNIAAMPEEPVQSAVGPMDAYLIEARSIGGLSGSPVFVNTVLDRSEDSSSILLAGSLLGSHLWLLGIMHGHWDAPVPDQDALLPSDGPRGPSTVNMGIAMVTPATKILGRSQHAQCALSQGSRRAGRRVSRARAGAAKRRRVAPPAATNRRSGASDNTSGAFETRTNAGASTSHPNSAVGGWRLFVGSRRCQPDLIRPGECWRVPRPLPSIAAWTSSFDPTAPSVSRNSDAIPKTWARGRRLHTSRIASSRRKPTRSTRPAKPFRGLVAFSILQSEDDLVQ